MTLTKPSRRQNPRKQLLRLLLKHPGLSCRLADKSHQYLWLPCSTSAPNQHYQRKRQRVLLLRLIANQKPRGDLSRMETERISMQLIPNIGPVVKAHSHAEFRMAVLTADGYEHFLITFVHHPVPLGTEASVFTTCHTPNCWPPMSTLPRVLGSPSIHQRNTNDLLRILPRAS